MREKIDDQFDYFLPSHKKNKLSIVLLLNGACQEQSVR